MSQKKRNFGSINRNPMISDIFKNILLVGAGCFLIGLLWGLFGKNGTEGGNWALFLTVGLCGGFTTFSTFSKEALMMLQAGNIWSFAGYVAISVVAGIALVALGYCLVR